MLEVESLPAHTHRRLAASQESPHAADRLVRLGEDALYFLLARLVGGEFLALRSADYVEAARALGAPPVRIILRHMVPSFLSFIIAALTLNIPGLILAETGLSFIGLGLRAPAISWGVLLQEATNISSLMLAPWVLAPGIAVVISVLAFNFLGDGLRDAADPYAR